jgi:energy-coupling factor transport system permease protein
LLHGLNPLSKLLATAPLLVFLAFVSDPYTPSVFAVSCAVATMVLGRVSPARYLRVALPLGLVIGLLVAYPLAVFGDVSAASPMVLDLGPLEVRQEGLLLGVATALRILSIFSLTLLFAFTTDSQDLVRALVQQWRLPYRLGYGALAAYRFVPRFSRELSVIRDAHQVRGVGDGGRLKGRYERLRRYSVPLLAGAVRHAERVALAMDARAFGAHPTRTYRRRLRFCPKDYLFVACFWGASLTVILALSAAGLLGPLTLSQTG